MKVTYGFVFFLYNKCQYDKVFEIDLYGHYKRKIVSFP